MERLQLNEGTVLINREHEHRYILAAGLAGGHVLDIACGTGYGSKILSKSFDKYTGVDQSQEDIERAREVFGGPNINFEVGDIFNLAFEDNSFDTIVCLETLEHLENPSAALEELTRVLKPNGVFIGSVPTAEYDDECERVYGENEFHITRFSRETLEAELKKNFTTHNVCSVCLEIGSVMRDLSSTDAKHSLAKDSAEESDIQGSFFFFATKAESFDKTLVKKFKELPGYQNCLPLISYDAEAVIPFRKAFESTTSEVDERDKTIAAYQKEVAALREGLEGYKNEAEGLRDSFSKAEEFIDERDAYIKKLEERVDSLEAEKIAKAAGGEV